MGAAIAVRNRHWWFRGLYDDYIGRETRLSFGLAAVIWIPHYVYGVYLNRTIETNTSHKIYSMEVGPSRNRLTHSMIFEQFEMVLENWEELNKEYAEKGKKMLQE
ncbi:unnamed protein product (macronuclear) [Paramecium tetraurelia]|uniref:Transmembrane protein n=1 Tax=Paramecium tetraurelia TaxID=5888 RepID=A0D7E5_PARTE|nr:uncharacterized protein GSPATT00002004001 [Paramecium tetraurelia]CAK78962.1 unnamed protein product [Paramecium tetraurelia]|eukprot:XP_001446359.1 hypothetical protein (macronuclear) [Paramecium tetraurelia strain d4-2]